MSNRWSGWAMACVLLAGSARADAPVIDAVSLARSGQAQRYELDLGGGAIRAGGAAIVVSARAAAVRGVVTDYGSYQTFLPGFQRSKILSRTAEGTDVYFQVPILHGASMLWAVARFAAPQKEGIGERIEGHMHGQGNVNDLRAVWHITPIDDGHTLLKLDLLLVPNLPLPPSLLTPALAENAGNAVVACRKRAEQMGIAATQP